MVNSTSRRSGPGREGRHLPSGGPAPRVCERDREVANRGGTRPPALIAGQPGAVRWPGQKIGQGFGQRRFAISNSRPVKCDSSWSSHFDSGSLTGPLPRGRRWSRRGLAEPEIARSRHSSGAFASSSRIANATLVEPQAKSDAWFPGSNAGLRRILKDRPLWCDSTYQSHQ